MALGTESIHEIPLGFGSCRFSSAEDRLGTICTSSLSRPISVELKEYTGYLILKRAERFGHLSLRQVDSSGHFVGYSQFPASETSNTCESFS